MSTVSCFWTTRGSIIATRCQREFCKRSILAFQMVVGVACGRLCIPTSGGHHAPTALPVRPLRRRVGYPRSVALVCRKARPSAEVAVEVRGGRRLLPAQERVFVADAA